MSAPGRILAVDWGRRRIGLAISDELGVSVRGLPTLEHTNGEADLQAIEKIVEDNEVRVLVVGQPFHLDGRSSASSRLAKRFGKNLAKRCGVELVLFDERLTSVEAEERLRKPKRGSRVPKTAIDQMAAQILLEGYLRSLEQA